MPWSDGPQSTSSDAACVRMESHKGTNSGIEVLLPIERQEMSSQPSIDPSPTSATQQSLQGEISRHTSANALGEISRHTSTNALVDAPTMGDAGLLEGAVARHASRLIMTPSHTPGQWQLIAEGFSQILAPDFVDIVFRVRGPSKQPAYIAAHRSLVAAAWPSLRDELATTGQSCSVELRKVALDWIEGDSAPERSAELDASSEGVLDVSAKQWGSYSILRALLCHLYNRPVVVQERKLERLRVAALALGSGELAKCCDDMESRPIRQWTSQPLPGVSRSGSAEERREGSSGSTSTVYAGSTLEEFVVRTQGKGLGTSARQPSETLTKDGVVVEVAGAAGASPATSSTARLPVLDLQRSDSAKKQEFLGEARAMPMAERAKPRGEHSFTGPDRNTHRSPHGEDQRDAERGSVHRVLSEIKRNIVESSRIIVDKSFKQRYEMVEGTRGVLGEGINGPVRMARNRKSGREVAVKRISCVNLSEQRRQMLVSEVRIFLQVSHRNIVQLLEVYESDVDQAVLLVMELCTGRELFERLQERKWYSEFDAARVTRQMLDAVSYLHSQNICHRDLKLENWLYENPSQEAKLKLCDFGFGQIVDPNVQLTATLGSLFYVAPEVLEGSYGLPCDMWSLGVIVYMLLSGVPPFDGKADADVMSKIRQGRFNSTGKRWEGISETAKHFVRSMLRKDPNERLTAAEVTQHAWLKMECQPKLLANSLWPKTGPDPELDCPIDRNVVRDIGNFAQNNAIMRAALGLLGRGAAPGLLAKIQSKTSFSGREQDVLLLEQRFKDHDQQGTGKIDAESFIKVLQETLHLQISSAEEKEFFERIAGSIPATVPEDSVYTGDKEQLGDKEKKKSKRRAVNYAEFIVLTKARRIANNTAAIREAFRSFDTNGEGFVKEDDMHKFLGDEYQTTIEKYMATVNGKEIIDYLHFANIISQEMAKKEEGHEMAKKDESDAAEKAAGDAAIAQVGAEALDIIPSPDKNVEVAPLTRETSVPTTGITAASGDVALKSGDQLPDTSNLGGGSGTSEVTEGEATRPEEPAAKQRTNLSEARKLSQDGPMERADNDDDENADARSDEEVEEPCDGQSDEEQLLNVVNALDTEQQEPGQSDAPQADDEAEKDKEKPKKDKQMSKLKEEKKEARFQSFSLSLAGSSEYDDVPVGVNRVASMPSDKYSIKQQTGFHTRVLKPFYASRPVSNIVLGLIRGTSLYAKQSVAAKLATIIHTACGWFFIMPNPKYHSEVDSRKGLLPKETGKFRFVAWWIHPRFVPQCRQWFERATALGAYERPDRAGGDGMERPDRASAQAGDDHSKQVAGGVPLPSAESTSSIPEGYAKTHGHGHTEQPHDHENLGSPGDFRFSDVPKPENYLHTYRDLHTRMHIDMLGQLWEGTNRFLRSMFDENFMGHASVSAGFHYPVRTQYATLHMQVRVNAGNICGDDGRGIEVQQLIELLKRDRKAFEADSEQVRYQVTENVKVSLLAAASEYEQQNPGESACRQLSPLQFELGATGMPTIHDEEDEDDAEDDSKREGGSGLSDHSSDRREGARRNEPEMTPDKSPTQRESQIAENHEVADEIPASYIINIQPTTGSRFHNLLYKYRKRCADEFGADPTYLYPLHGSVTGFFEASKKQISKLRTLIPDMLQRELREAGGVSVGKVICTKTGYVLFDMNAEAISNFSQRLGEVSARQYGLHIRPKAVNHISLACNRPDELQRDKIRAIWEPDVDDQTFESRDDQTAAFEPVPPGDVAEILQTPEFDLVLSRLVTRSSFERLEEDGPHTFNEVVRIPLLPLSHTQEGRNDSGSPAPA